MQYGSILIRCHLTCAAIYPNKYPLLTQAFIGVLSIKDDTAKYEPLHSNINFGRRKDRFPGRLTLNIVFGAPQVRLIKLTTILPLSKTIYFKFLLPNFFSRIIFS